jgi:hypothetical protein
MPYRAWYERSESRHPRSARVVAFRPPYAGGLTTMFSDVIFYLMVWLIPGMALLALLLRRNPFEEGGTKSEKTDRRS